MVWNLQNNMGYGQAAVLLLLLYYTDADVKMTGPSTYTATLGREANIPCTFTLDQKLKYPQLEVYWYDNISIIAGTNDSPRYNTSKYSMDKDQALNGIANLRISKISTADHGIYKCSVSYAGPPEPTIREITTTVQAVPKITVVNDDIMINKMSFLCCEISGFYPVDINITWLQDGEPLGNVLQGKLQNNSDGTYSINSSIILRLTEEDRKRNFSCRVQHVSSPTPLNKDLQLYIYEGWALNLSAQKAMMGKDVNVPCSFTVKSPPIDRKYLSIIWYFQGKEIFSVQNTAVKSTDPRMSYTSRAEDGIADLSISNINITDRGIYKCFILYRSEMEEKEIRLDVQDANIPMNPVQRNGENANAGEENDPEPEQNDEEEREPLNQE
ncbi:natural cytotoxicity triggering receptor 3 ligand 1-like isoform X2 [Aquarana catesbeiana]|uniref:natural cytotoxicity triggering receptor 3 ligand 1-like isoform X2 n=1 Tax=Aquarana catesbeiana TaxID=8400 RepID=UPI003CC93E17